MKLLLFLATWLVTGRTARIPRGIVNFGYPNFHAVHHGYGATSYQNVQVENYGSVPIPTEHHRDDHELVKKHDLIYVHDEPHYAHHEDHVEVPLEVNLIPITEKHHAHKLILLEKVPFTKNEIQYVTFNEPSYSDHYDEYH